MICKNCGNKILEGTYCLRCGTENDEKKIDNYLTEIKNEKNSKKRKKESNLFAKIFIVWIILFAIIAIIYHIMDNSFNSCIEKHGQKECGLGTFCDHECMPPFYYTTSIIYDISLFVTKIVCPLTLFIIILDKFVDKSDRKKIDSLE